jgi:PST family polysaccharide transporter
MFWAYGSFVGARAATLVATAVLARLLVPRDFGLVALALIFIALLETLSDLGVSQALVVSKKEEELERAETVFVWSVFFGAVLALLTAAAAPFAASFFHEPALRGLLPVLGARFLLRSLGQTHYSLAQKWIEFRPRTVAELSDAVTRGLVGVGLALAGFGAWSLVLGYLAGAAALTGVLWIMVPWRPRLKPKREHLPSLMRFGGQLTGVDILAAIQNNADYFFIGRFLTAADLGLYTLGFRLPELLILNLAVVAGRVLFPAFAAVDRSRLGEAFLLSLRYTLMFALPIAAGLAILAHPFTVALFGERWEDSVGPMQLLTIYALGVTIGIPAGTAYKAVGRAGVLLALGVPRTLLLIAAIAIFVDNGIVAVAACMAGVAALFATIGLLLAMRLLAVGPRSVWSAVWPTLVSTAGMAAVLIPVERGIESPWMELTLGVAAGGATYTALLFLFARDALVRLRDTGFPTVRAPEKATATTISDVVT